MKREMSAEARARQLSGLMPGGQKSPFRRKAKRSNAEYARQYGAEMIERLVEIARHGEPDAVRIVAANSVLERGFGKVLGSDPTATTPTTVIVQTGVRDRGPDEADPPAWLIGRMAVTYLQHTPPSRCRPRPVPSAARRCRNRRSIGFSREKRRSSAPSSKKL
jgi:hypothetical protein